MNSSKPTPPEGHGPKEFTIIVNGRPKKVTQDQLSFDEVVALAGLPTGPNIVFTVTYRKGHNEGVLVAGETVNIENGMIFNVTATDKS